MEGLELYEWQKDLLNIINQPVNPRKIYWRHASDGCEGKTSFSKHICMTRNAILLSGKVADIKDGVARHLAKHKELDVAIFHFVRSDEEYISYAGIESIKDGIFFSGKFESSMCMFNSPHIIIFANFAPKLNKLSKDRWDVCDIGRPGSAPLSPGGGGSLFSHESDIED